VSLAKADARSTDLYDRPPGFSSSSLSAPGFGTTVGFPAAGLTMVMSTRHRHRGLSGDIELRFGTPHQVELIGFLVEQLQFNTFSSITDGAFTDGIFSRARERGAVHRHSACRSSR